ncbi:nuclease-related domain-containing protein [Aliidiomarina indica]|uniref:nuclease-related domain-containing protein n=1 Tax=Aliidiomarina indica TaxID=2749147 RepID=UPI00188DFAB7|nr:nuclease-related domain-containing protein [Aliidiomarina indica]
MILKEKAPSNTASVRLAAGNKQEYDVAFYLRRAYRDSERVMVLNDIRITHEGERAQIDHLIVYTYGFIIVESKSIRGQVIVNSEGEWIRSYNNKWSGMPSPIKQAELQLKLLQQFLYANTDDIIGKFLGIQQGLAGRRYDVFCAISSDSIIDRTNAPKDVAGKLIKSEFITDALDKAMNFRKFYQVAKKVLDTRPAFNFDELRGICNFILAHQTGAEKKSLDETPFKIPEDYLSVEPPSISARCDSNTHFMSCRHCGNDQSLTTHSGRYGYYVKCPKCAGNTALKSPCATCNSTSTSVKKRNDVFSLHCDSCYSATRLDFN